MFIESVQLEDSVNRPILIFEFVRIKAINYAISIKFPNRAWSILQGQILPTKPKFVVLQSFYTSLSYSILSSNCKQRRNIHF